MKSRRAGTAVHLVTAVALCLALAAEAQAQSFSVSDGDFDAGDYETHIVKVGDAESSAATVSAGGNPDAYRNVVLDLDVDEAALHAQLYLPAAFHPAVRGEATSVRVAYDIRRTFTNYPTATQVAKGISVRQDGVLHNYLVGVSTSETWEHVEVADIVPLFPGVNWVDGGPILIGFYNSATAGLGVPFEIHGGYDNLEIEIAYTPSYQLPFFETGDLFLRAPGGEFYRTDANPAGLSVIGKCRMSGGSSVFDQDGLLYTDAASGNGIDIFDRNFQLLGSAPVNGGDPALSYVQFVALRGNGQLFGTNPLSPGPSRLFVFDVTDPASPALSSIQDIPHSAAGAQSRGLAFDRNGSLWICLSGALVKLELDAAGTILSDIRFPTSGVNPYHLAFQPGTNRLFTSAINSNFIAVVDPSDPLTRIANITDVADTTSNTPLSLAFDSSGNLFVGAHGIGELVSLPAASLVSLSGDVEAADLGAVTNDLVNGAVKTFSFKPKGVSRDPFTIDAGDNLVILSQDQSVTSLTGTITTDPLGESFRGGWIFEGDFVAGPGILPNPFSFSLSGVDPLPVGDHVFTFEVDGCMLTVRDTVVVTVENSPPTAAPSGGGVFPSGSGFDVGGQVADHDGDTLVYEWRLGTTVLASGVVNTVLGGDPVALPATTLQANDLGVGVHQLDLAVDDGVNPEVVSCITVEIFQSDTTAPTCDPEPSTTILWPPNHELVPVTIDVNAADDSGGPVAIAVSVAVNDGDTNGDNTDPDVVIDDDGNTDGIVRLQLRTERAGKGDGRVYTITITVTDEAGNASACEVEIRAPHSQGNGNQ